MTDELEGYKAGTYITDIASGGPKLIACIHLRKINIMKLLKLKL